MHTPCTQYQRGFTLIELSIVLVIIGLIAGGVLVGQNLISSSQVNATISQIGKYNSAVNAFQQKYAALPGDLNAQTATAYNFAPRGTGGGMGNGDGVIEAPGGEYGTRNGYGETAMFWVDLSAANLIDGTFNTANSTTLPGSDVTGSGLDLYFPQAKLGQGNYIYVWSGGIGSHTANSAADGFNYFGISAVSRIQVSGNSGGLWSAPALSVQQAYSMDTKMDDGLPQSGNVTADYINMGAPGGGGAEWAAGGGVWGANGGSGNRGPTTAATAGSATTCYDNGSVGGAPQQYSLAQSGSAFNCALSYRFQ